MLIERKSMFTGKINVMDLDVTHDELERWMDGELIQKVFPHLTTDEREFLMTGTTPEEWEKFNKDDYNEAEGDF
jgi:hypothetical protein